LIHARIAGSVRSKHLAAILPDFRESGGDSTKKALLGFGSSPQRRRFGRAVLVFLHFFDGFLRWNHPFEAVRSSMVPRTNVRFPATKGSTARHEIS